MDELFNQYEVDGELTSELIKYKAELIQNMNNELSKVEADRSSYIWSEDEKQFIYKDALYAKIKQKYTDLWLQALTNAGYLVRPVFESIEKPSFEEWYEELNRIN